MNWHKVSLPSSNKSRIVFWYDPEQSFTEELEYLANALSSTKESVAKEAHLNEKQDKAADITARGTLKI